MSSRLVWTTGVDGRLRTGQPMGQGAGAVVWPCGESAAVTWQWMAWDGDANAASRCGLLTSVACVQEVAAWFDRSAAIFYTSEHDTTAPVDARMAEDHILRGRIIVALSDHMSRFLYYDRKEDIDLPVCAIEDALQRVVITPDDLLRVVRRSIESAMQKYRICYEAATETG